MAFEGAQMVPVYDMNKSDNAGMMGGGAGWMWVIWRDDISCLYKDW